MGLIDLLAGEQEDLRELLGWFLETEDAPDLDEGQLQVIAKITHQLNTPSPPPEQVWLVTWESSEDEGWGSRIIRGNKERADAAAKMMEQVDSGKTWVLEVTEADDFDEILSNWMETIVINQEDGII